jgi:hypothetical protein
MIRFVVMSLYLVYQDSYWSNGYNTLGTIQ